MATNTILGVQGDLYLIQVCTSKALVLDVSSDPPVALPAAPFSFYAGNWDPFTGDPAVVLDKLANAEHRTEISFVTEAQTLPFTHGDVLLADSSGKELPAK